MQEARVEPQQALGRRRHPLRRRSTLLACLLLVLLVAVPPLVNLGRFQRRIAGAISRSIGRPVSMDAVSLRLLPWPAFKIENLSVGEDPAFGAEPALRAPEVLAELRLSSLWGGRFELSRVELSDASVNLVRNNAGRWNISSVLLQASHIQNAPTGQTRPGPAPRFPYIQATGTRINFKRGLEKLPYSVLNADFFMFLARPEVWRLKLEGQPVRTDLELSLNDTGLLRLEGEVHRASAFGTMPLSLQGEWSHAALGQLSRMLLGSDTGWRGDIDVTAQFTGEIDNLDTRMHLLVANFHRQEFTPEQPFTIDATCHAVYSRSESPADAFGCRWPLGNGALLLTHAATTDAPLQAAKNLTLTADKVPAGVVAAAIGLWHGGAAGGQRFNGEIFNGEINGSYTYDLATHRLAGSVAASRLSITEAGLDGAPLVLTGAQLAAGAGAQPILQFTSDPLPLGIAATPMALSAELMGHGYSLHAKGAGSLAALQAAASALHLPGLAHVSSLSLNTRQSPPKQATAQMALTTSGSWLSAPTGNTPENASFNTAGTIHFENVRWETAWLPCPVEYTSVDAAFSPGSVRWTTPSASIGNEPTPLHFAGYAQVPAPCAAKELCPIQFSLNTASLDVGVLQRAMGGRSSRFFPALLDRFAAPQVHLPAFGGSVHAGVLTLGKLPMHDASLVLAADTQSPLAIQIERFDAHALGGTLHLTGALSLAGAIPRYTLKTSLASVSATQTADLWQENWGPGTLDGTADLVMSGSTMPDLLQSATGSFHLSWLHGSLAPALPRFASWDAEGLFASNGLRLEHSTVSGTPGMLTGTIGWDRSLDLQLVSGPDVQPTAIIGTLAAPVAQAPEAAPAAAP